MCGGGGVVGSNRLRTTVERVPSLGPLQGLHNWNARGGVGAECPRLIVAWRRVGLQPVKPREVALVRVTVRFWSLRAGTGVEGTL